MSVSVGKQFLPTKLELIRLKRSLAVARNVHRILEDKRDIIIKRLDELIDQATEAREKIAEPLSGAFKALDDAYMALGPTKVESASLTTPESIDIDIKTRNIMGIRVPYITISEKKLGLTYGFADTGVTLDNAANAFRNLVSSICKAAEVENAIFRLAEELKKTQRMLNALENVVMPRYEQAIKFISSTLEERAREEFVKLKHVKMVLERRKVGHG